MPNDQEIISQLRLAMEQARRCAAQLREAGWEVQFVRNDKIEEQTAETAGTFGSPCLDVTVLIERTTREEHKL